MEESSLSGVAVMSRSHCRRRGPAAATSATVTGCHAAPDVSPCSWFTCTTPGGTRTRKRQAHTGHGHPARPEGHAPPPPPSLPLNGGERRRARTGQQRLAGCRERMRRAARPPPARAVTFTTHRAGVVEDGDAPRVEAEERGRHEHRAQHRLCARTHTAHHSLYERAAALRHHVARMPCDDNDGITGRACERAPFPPRRSSSEWRPLPPSQEGHRGGCCPVRTTTRCRAAAAATPRPRSPGSVGCRAAGRRVRTRAPAGTARRSPCRWPPSRPPAATRASRCACTRARRRRPL